jgi:hypothetical protein
MENLFDDDDDDSILDLDASISAMLDGILVQVEEMENEYIRRKQVNGISSQLLHVDGMFHIPSNKRVPQCRPHS